MKHAGTSRSAETGAWTPQPRPPDYGRETKSLFSGGVLFGGSRCLVACSNAYAIAMSRGSLNARPESVTPNGAGSGTNPAGNGGAGGGTGANPPAGTMPGRASTPSSIQTGDLMLYGPSTLLLFYKSFSTTYSYTKIGRIDDPAGLEAALGSGNVAVTFEVRREKR